MGEFIRVSSPSGEKFIPVHRVRSVHVDKADVRAEAEANFAHPRTARLTLDDGKSETVPLSTWREVERGMGDLIPAAEGWRAVRVQIDHEHGQNFRGIHGDRLGCSVLISPIVAWRIQGLTAWPVSPNVESFDPSGVGQSIGIMDPSGAVTEFVPNSYAGDGEPELFMHWLTRTIDFLTGQFKHGRHEIAAPDEEEV